MLEAQIETQDVTDAISTARKSIREQLGERYAKLQRPGYALPMAWWCAGAVSNKIVDSVPRYSSADHGSVFKSLITFARNVLMTPHNEFTGPHFNSALEPDSEIECCINYEFEQLFLLNLEVSLREGYWRWTQEQNDGSFRLSLAPPQRRSALTLLDHKVEFEGYPQEIRDVLTNPSSPGNAVALALATGMQEVAFIQNAIPEVWRRLENKIGFSVTEAAAFHAFIQSLVGHGFHWFQSHELLEEFVEFTSEHNIATIPEDRFHSMLDFFSAPPEVIESWGIALPFVRFGDWLAYWPFVHHILPPSLTFLSLAMRKYPNDWNNTVGAHLAEVAKAVCAGLQAEEDLLYVTTKSKAGVGDIDLGIYNPKSQVLLLCEIKTVFDRFRTNYQFSNFSNQRVNFSKAAAQIKASMDAIHTGTWPLSDIFGRRLDGPPKRILPLVMTWYDQHNPWLGDNIEGLVSCNFRVFQHLFSQASGDLVMVYESIMQLSQIYCVATLRPLRLSIADKSIAVDREVQTDLLPMEETLLSMPLSDLVREEIRPMAKLPPDWKSQLVAAGANPKNYYAYEFDEH